MCGMSSTRWDIRTTTWPIRIWLAGVDGVASVPKLRVAASGGDERARLRLLGGELKWLVWNAVWGETNTGYARGLAGRDGHAKSHEQKVEKAKADQRRVDEHHRMAVASGLVPHGVLEALGKAGAAGREASAACLQGRAFKEAPVEGAPVPPGRATRPCGPRSPRA